MTEALIYDKNGVEISPTLVRISDASYPVNGIGSVYIKQPSRAGWFFIGGLLALLGVAALAGGDRGGSWVFLALGILLIFAGVGQPYILVLRTASGDQKVLRDAKRAVLAEIQSAIEEAVRVRG